MSETSFQSEVGTWGDVTFPDSNVKSCAAHLRREVAELCADILKGRDLSEELADCYLLLLHLAHKGGVDLHKAAQDKMLINRARQWGTPDAEGVVEHIR